MKARIRRTLQRYVPQWAKPWLRWVKTHVDRMRRRWRRSLTLRIVSITLVIGTLMLAIVGALLLRRVSDSLVDSARAAALRDARQQVESTMFAFRSQKFDNEQDLRVWVRQRLNDMHGPAQTPLRYVVLLKDDSSKPGTMADQGLGVDASAIPAQLRSKVVSTSQELVTQLVTVPIRADQTTTARTSIVVGSHVDFGPLGAGPNDQATGGYELYFLYPLDREDVILSDIRWAFAGGAIALLLLIGWVAALVTRQVVDPVREAARTAEELSSGRLDQRMTLTGEDDLARLSRAFNDMADSLEQQIKELEELSRVQQRFVSDVSHELRTPLTTVRMAGEVLYEARGNFDPSLARTAELLHAQLDRFEALLADLLEVSRFDAGAAVLDAEQVDVREVAQRAVEGLVPIAERRGCQVTLRTPHESVMASVDSRRVERVVRNLVGNAIEHSEAKPIDITVEFDDESLAIGVRDHGVGLSNDDIRMVFNRFWRADTSRARRTGGTGLGLAIAQEDARLHGGDLQVWGRLGAGAHFVMTLPRNSGHRLNSFPIPVVPEREQLPGEEQPEEAQSEESGDAVTALTPDPTAEPHSGANSLRAAADSLRDAAATVAVPSTDRRADQETS